jgi:hypothetical protein
MRKVSAVLALLFVMGAITGCKLHYHLPILWFGPSGAWQTFDVAIAVAPDGAKQIFYVNCSYNGYCTITHEKNYQGEPHALMHLYTPETDYTSIVPFYRFPDAAVADNGITYLVWHYMDHNGYYYDCWNYIAADNSVPNASCNPLQDEAQYSPENSYPKVVTYDNVAYAVYEVYGGSTNSLYYRQLSPLDASHGQVTGVGGGTSANPSLAVSSYIDEDEQTRYVLHVAWANEWGNASSRTVYNNNYGVTGNMISQRISSDIGSRSDPVIVTIDSSSKTYIVYRLDGTPDKLALEYCDLPKCSVMIGVPDLLFGVGNWELMGRPDMIAGGENIIITFTGMNDTTQVDTSFQEVFHVTYQAGGSIPVTVWRITNNNDEEGDTRIVWVTDSDGATAVIAWRNNPDEGYYRDAYIYDIITDASFGSDGIRMILQSPDAVAGGYFDIASNGPNIGGIVIDLYSSIEGRHYPWFTFNGYGTYQPIINRP